MESSQSYLFRLKSIHDLQLNVMKRSVHDLKSPIGGISGYLELMDVCLNSGGDLQKLDRYRTQIDKGLDEINSIVNQLHELTKESFDIDVGGFFSETDICEVVEDVCNNMEGLCRQKNVGLECKSSVESLRLSVDLMLLKLTLMNLTCNAIKYTAKPGKIIFGITKTEKEVYIHINSNKTTRPEKDIEQVFLEELTYLNKEKPDSILDSSPYYFGAQCTGLIYKGAKMSVDYANSFTVSICFDLPASTTQ